jgi:hypothetical protein
MQSSQQERIMKAMMSGCLAVVFATMFAACGVEPAQSDQSASETSSDLTSADPAPQLVYVPPELRMSPDELDDVLGDEATPKACHVTLQFCRDPGSGLPSYCSNGCTATNAAIIAASLCIRICGNIDCTHLTNHGGC